MIKPLKNNIYHYRAFMISVGCLIGIIVGEGTQHKSYAEPIPKMGYEQKLDQARLYINNQMFLAALNELKQLSTTARGQSDTRVFTALAKVHYKLHNITAALGSLREARRLTRDEGIRSRLTELYDQWLHMYGLVRLESADSRSNGGITLKRSRKIINKERREMLEHIREELSQGVTLPVSVYLPYGNYEANGVPFRLERDQPTPVINVVLTHLLQATPISEEEGTSPWFYVGVGSAAVVVLSVGSYFLLGDDPPQNPRAVNITLSGE